MVSAHPEVDTEMDFDQASSVKSSKPYPFNGIYRQVNVLLKERNPRFKSIISVGGWDFSHRFSDVAATYVGRQVFAASCVEFLKNYHFDGVDVCWEFPGEGGNTEYALVDTEAAKSPVKYLNRPNDGANMVALLHAVRKAMDEAGPNPLSAEPYYLSVACPPLVSLYRHLDLYSLSEVVDSINVMCYDLRGLWSSLTGHHQQLYRSTHDPVRELGSGSSDVASVIKAYHKNGADLKKLVVSVAMYGRAFGGVLPSKIRKDGLFSRFDPAATLVGSGADESGVVNFWQVKQMLLSTNSGYVKHWDNQCKAESAYNAEKRIFMSYPSPKSMIQKCKFVTKNNLAGIMCWDLGGDERRVFDEDKYVPGWDLLDTAVQYLRGQTWGSRVPSFSRYRTLGRQRKVLELPSVEPNVDDVADSVIEPAHLTKHRTHNKMVIASFNSAGLYQRGVTLDSLPLSACTHVHYGQAKVEDDGTVVAGDQWAGMCKSYFTLIF